MKSLINDLKKTNDEMNSLQLTTITAIVSTFKNIRDSHRIFNDVKIICGNLINDNVCSTIIDGDKVYYYELNALGAIVAHRMLQPGELT